jgi:SAM-dependent methyltransferase
MARLFWIALIGVFTLTLMIIGWRFLSRRYPLHCPATIIWMLENRIMEDVAGSEVLLKRAQIMPGMAVLDAGCGPGRVIVPLAACVTAGGRVTALDIRPERPERL